MITTIEAGDARCSIAPHLGGSLLSWTIGNQPMLRTASSTATATGLRLGFSAFPLVPFSNRIDYGRFTWNGEIHTLRPNFPPEPHRIHGNGWEDAWHVERRTADTIRLTLAHLPDDRWPWAFRAAQELVLEPDALELRLSAINQADQPVPLAFGYHPYFDLAGASMFFEAAHIWTSATGGLPDTCSAPRDAADFSRRATVAGRNLDNCYDGVISPCRIVWEDRPWALTIDSPMPAAVVYAPPQGAAFCFEPVPHLIDAINHPGRLPAMPIIEPGDAYRATIRMQADRR